jgi:hypothetical protein
MRKKINSHAIAFKKKIDKRIQTLTKMKGGAFGDNTPGVDNQNAQNANTSQIVEVKEKEAENQSKVELSELDKQKDALKNLINSKNKEESDKATAGVVNVKDMKVANIDKIFVANALSKILKIGGKVGSSIPLLNAATDSLSKALDTYKDYVQIQEIIVSLKDCVFFAVRLISLIRITKVIFDTTIEQTINTYIDNTGKIAMNETMQETTKSVQPIGGIPTEIALEVKQTPTQLLAEMSDLQFVPEIEYQILAKLDAIKILLKPYDAAKTIDPNVYREMLFPKKSMLSGKITNPNSKILKKEMLHSLQKM